MFVYLLQHGDAVSKDVDPERPLSEQGVQDIRKLANHLKTRGVAPARILHSGKLRAEQSADLIAEILLPGVKSIQADGLYPNDDPAASVATLRGLKGDVLIASHMPFVSRLCSTLLTGTTEAEFASKPGTLFCLEKSDDRWRLAWMLRPDFL